MKKTVLITILTIVFFAICSTGVLATGRQIGNDIAGTAEDVGDGMRQMGNGVVDGMQDAAGMARDAGNGIVNGVDTTMQRTGNTVRDMGESAKNQSQTMTTDNTLSGNDNWQSAKFLGISFSVWMWIILIIVIIIIVVLICKYMKEHDDNGHDRDDD